MNGPSIGVIGAGSWGTALSNHLATKGFNIDLWARREELCKGIRETHRNPDYLPEIELSPLISPTTSIEETVSGKDIILLALPTHAIRSVLSTACPAISKGAIIVSTTKGIEEDTLLTPSGIIEDVLSDTEIEGIVSLSGPSFAKEVGQRLPTAVCAASCRKDIAEEIQRVFNTEYFRVYTNTDLIGVELGGALKNIIAIAAGICDGLRLGNNSRAALITRGLAEIRRLGVTMGARAETFSGLSGLGDLVLTCTGVLSRNHYVGTMLAQGHPLQQILSGMKMVAEGVKTTRSAYMLSRKLKVDMPITDKVYGILYNNDDPKKAVINLMTRELKEE